MRGRPRGSIPLVEESGMQGLNQSLETRYKQVEVGGGTREREGPRCRASSGGKHGRLVLFGLLTLSPALDLRA